MVEFWKITAPILAIVLGWVVNEFFRRAHERRNLAWEMFKKKELIYTKLIVASKGFAMNTQSSILKDEFIENYNLCWLLAPDNVIYKAKNFLDALHVDDRSKGRDAKKAREELIVALRRDLTALQFPVKSSLTAKDVEHYTTA